MSSPLVVCCMMHMFVLDEALKLGDGGMNKITRRLLMAKIPSTFVVVPAIAAEPSAKLIIADEVRIGQGDGPPKIGQTVSIDYSLWLDGFDSGKQLSKGEKGGPVYVQLGEGKLPKGVEEALLSMRVGGIRRIIVPAELAYGSTGYPRQGENKGAIIPPNATLYIELRLRTIKTQYTLFGLGIY
mmetsp:Transcript_15811/g.20795  ORF Transcript_15811/g.20795 Transcript_15811/m.20795 type:complete len:184 (-) Transcript_15811:255-806(-)